MLISNVAGRYADRAYIAGAGLALGKRLALFGAGLFRPFAVGVAFLKHHLAGLSVTAGFCLLLPVS